MQQSKVRKAVIPAAGFGTRLFPATKVVKKELFPIIDRDNRVKPAILAIVEEAIVSGIEEIGIVVQPSDREIFADFFQNPPKQELFNKLSSADREYCHYLQEIGKRITILTQEEQEGYGHAVYCAREWVKNETFLLMLGDHIYSSNTDKPCARQVLDVYEEVHQNTIGLVELPETIIHKAGCVAGVWRSFNEMLTLTQVCEKPSVEYAKQNLVVEGISSERFLCIFGLYILTAKIFDFLQEHIQSNFRERGEFQLTSCLEQLRQAEGMIGYVVKGTTFDIGMPDAYRQTMIDFRG